MVKLGLKPLKRNKRKYSSYKGKDGKIADNHIDREFEADKPNKNFRKINSTLLSDVLL